MSRGEKSFRSTKERFGSIFGAVPKSKEIQKTKHEKIDRQWEKDTLESVLH